VNPFDRNELVEQILANLNILIYAMDHMSNYLFIGQQCEAFTGYSKSYFVDNHKMWINHIHEADQDYYREKTTELLTKRTSSMEYRFLCGDGTVKWYKDSATAVRDAENNVIRIDGTIQDISAQRAVEKELRLIRSAII